MQTMTLHMQNGEVIFHCAGCARDFYVDSSKPFVPQLREMSYGHHCYQLPAHMESDTVLSGLLDR
jgi:hypothetical protein